MITCDDDNTIIKIIKKIMNDFENILKYNYENNKIYSEINNYYFKNNIKIT